MNWCHLAKAVFVLFFWVVFSQIGWHRISAIGWAEKNWSNTEWEKKHCFWH